MVLPIIPISSFRVSFPVSVAIELLGNSALEPNKEHPAIPIDSPTKISGMRIAKQQRFKETFVIEGNFTNKSSKL
jgi:hypothetical protein